MNSSNLVAPIILAVCGLAACAARGADLRAGGVFTREVDLSSLFAGSTAPVEAAFVLLNGRTGESTVYNPDRARQRYRPASTFKIPNTLIALETGVVPDVGFTLPFDPALVPEQGFFASSWKRDHDLRSAFRNSVYWYYQEVARRIGPKRMAEWLDRFDYGNQSVGGGLDQFWLRGDLRISPLEQVNFLRRLHQRQVPVSDRSWEILKEIMLLEETPAYRLYGKTGSSDVTPTRENGWLVGFVEIERTPYFYALNMEGESVWEDWPPASRMELVKEMLEAVLGAEFRVLS